YVVDDQEPARRLGSHKCAALAVILDFFAIERPRYIAVKMFGQLHRGSACQRNALVRGTEQHVEFDAAVNGRRSIKPAQGSQMRAGIELSRVKEIRRHPPGLEGEPTESQDIGVQRIFDKAPLIGGELRPAHSPAFCTSGLRCLEIRSPKTTLRLSV